MKWSLRAVLSIFLATQAALAQNITVNPNDQTELIFHDGVVLVTCGAEKANQKVSTDLFNQAFPPLLTALGEFIKQGKLIRAHYLGELKEGVFLVVGGSDRSIAMENAKEIAAETTKVLKKAMLDAKVEDDFQLNDSCRYTEVGPLFLQ